MGRIRWTIDPWNFPKAWIFPINLGPAAACGNGGAFAVKEAWFRRSAARGGRAKAGPSAVGGAESAAVGESAWVLGRECVRRRAGVARVPGGHGARDTGRVLGAGAGGCGVPGEARGRWG